MLSVALPGYRADDLPGCLALVGLARVLALDCGCPAAVSWSTDGIGRLHLPDGWTVDRISLSLGAAAAARAESQHWSLWDLCDDPAGWATAVAAAFNGPVARGNRGGADVLAACAHYRQVRDGEWQGGRSPLITTSRNMTPGRWGRKAAEAAVKTDWGSHFLGWASGTGSWQGWRPPGGLKADPAAVWLAMEGLPLWPCDIAVRPGDLARKHVRVPGWMAEGLWAYPLWDQPAGPDVIRSYLSLVVDPDTGSVRPRAHLAARGVFAVAMFKREIVKQGDYNLLEFQRGGRV